MVVDELCPGKCKGKSHVAVASVLRAVVELLKQWLEKTHSHGIMSVVEVSESRVVPRQENPTTQYPWMCTCVQPAGRLRQREG